MVGTSLPPPPTPTMRPLGTKNDVTGSLFYLPSLSASKFTPLNHPLIEGLSPGCGFGREEAIFRDGVGVGGEHTGPTSAPGPGLLIPPALGCEG